MTHFEKDRLRVGNWTSDGAFKAAVDVWTVYLSVSKPQNKTFFYLKLLNMMIRGDNYSVFFVCKSEKAVAAVARRRLIFKKATTKKHIASEIRMQIKGKV